MRWALSRRSRKYGSWSIAHGMRQGIDAVDAFRASVGESPQISGYEVANAATHCMAGKKTRPMFVL